MALVAARWDREARRLTDRSPHFRVGSGGTYIGGRGSRATILETLESTVMAVCEVSHELLLDHLPDGVVFVGIDRLITYWNKGAERITGYSRAETVGRPCSPELLGSSPAANGRTNESTCPALDLLSNGGPVELSLTLVHKKGHPIPIHARISPVLGPKNETIGVMEVFSDNLEKIQTLERIRKLEELALLCPLTEVGNRRYIELALRAAHDEFKRYGNKFGVLFIDLDHFKLINDTYGHAVGDEILRMVAHALRSCLRAFDFVGRWGGEEFVVLLPNVDSRLLTIVANRCHAILQEASYQHNGRHIQVTASVGATLAHLDESPVELIERADRLMYQSKAIGRNRVTYDTVFQ